MAGLINSKHHGQTKLTNYELTIVKHPLMKGVFLQKADFQICAGEDNPLWSCWQLLSLTSAKTRSHHKNGTWSRVRHQSVSPTYHLSVPSTVLRFVVFPRVEETDKCEKLWIKNLYSKNSNCWFFMSLIYPELYQCLSQVFLWLCSLDLLMSQSDGIGSDSLRAVSSHIMSRVGWGLGNWL